MHLSYQLLQRAGNAIDRDIVRGLAIDMAKVAEVELLLEVRKHYFAARVKTSSDMLSLLLVSAAISEKSSPKEQIGAAASDAVFVASCEQRGVETHGVERMLSAYEPDVLIAALEYLSVHELGPSKPDLLARSADLLWCAERQATASIEALSSAGN